MASSINKMLSTSPIDKWAFSRLTRIKSTIFRDTYQFVSIYKQCQRARMTIIFDIWGIDFMGPFLVSNGYSYILLAVNYVSRWVEAAATKTNDAKVVMDFLKPISSANLGVTSTTELCPPYSKSMACRMELPQHTTPRQTTKRKYSIRKSRKSCKRWLIPTRRIGANSLRMILYGRIRLHIGLR
ncbi:hypothetical protein CR513_21226, partial [Mucuna pruriens]